MVTPAPEAPATAAPLDAKPGGWQRWRGPVLFVSLGVNLFLVGLMVGDRIPPRHRPHWLGFHLSDERGPREMGPREAGRSGMPGLRGGGDGMAQAMPGGPAAALAFRQAIQSLPEGDRQPFEEALRAVRPDVQSARRELGQVRQRVGETIRADPFDRDALVKALAEIRQRQDAIQQRLHASTVEAVAKLSPEARRQFADALAARMRQ